MASHIIFSYMFSRDVNIQSYNEEVYDFCKVRSKLNSPLQCKPLQLSASYHSLTPSYDKYRRWETVGLTSNGTFGTSTEFKIMSYNIRAQSLLEKYSWFYKNCSRHSLLWENRVPRLFNDIINQLPDILCLQEVEEHQLGMFDLKLHELGYQGDFNSKPDSYVVELLQIGQVSTIEEPQWNNEEWQNIGITDNCQHLSVFVNRSYGLSTDFRELHIYNSEYSTLCDQDNKSFSSEIFHEAMFYDLFHSNIVSNTLHFRSIYETNRAVKHVYNWLLHTGNTAVSLDKNGWKKAGSEKHSYENES
ncbi:hypothetical protein HW555_010201 [Spodoptera exigua]|uniref:Endonuclease/exonuclease/phosphatase domain-containing protein n=1 Tax=Spodoptera exigua TaxID=7107 RepID=A0A835GB53_SPOEX|nr:hypothetical protein HW555_010201 [Spodoptera exigua]